MKKTLCCLTLFMFALLLFLAGCTGIREMQNSYIYNHYSDIYPQVDIEFINENIEAEVDGTIYERMQTLMWIPEQNNVSVIGVGASGGTTLIFETSSPYCLYAENIYDINTGLSGTIYFYNSEIEETAWTSIDKITGFNCNWIDNSDITKDDSEEIVEELIEIVNDEDSYLSKEESDLTKVGLLTVYSDNELYNGMKSPFFSVYSEPNNPDVYYLDYRYGENRQKEFVDITQVLSSLQKYSLNAYKNN